MPSISSPAIHVARAADSCIPWHRTPGQGCLRCKCLGSTLLSLRRVVEKDDLKYNDLDPQTRGAGK